MKPEPVIDPGKCDCPPWARQVMGPAGCICQPMPIVDPTACACMPGPPGNANYSVNN